MIPKKIHYCWFGRNPKPKLAEKCIRSWQRRCPDYEIIEWNEDNYDLTQAPLYVRQAYEAKKWAFVTDYVRLQVIYEQGGIYMDTDVELRKNLDKLLEHQAYFGFEDDTYIATGLGFGAVRGLSLLQELMQDYLEIPFVLEDGNYDLQPCPVRNIAVFLRHGLLQDGSRQILDGDIMILPREYLSPIDTRTYIRTITENTISIHWFSASWCSKEELKKKEKYRRMNRFYRITGKVCQFGRAMLGDRVYEKMKKFVKPGK